jgi:hypothetical protein
MQRGTAEIVGPLKSSHIVGAARETRKLMLEVSASFCISETGYWAVGLDD